MNMIVTFRSRRYTDNDRKSAQTLYIFYITVRNTIWYMMRFCSRNYFVAVMRKFTRSRRRNFSMSFRSREKIRQFSVRDVLLERIDERRVKQDDGPRYRPVSL